MADEKVLTLLHISDFHFAKRKYREQEIVIDALIADLKTLCVGHRRPDLILFTGDLVNAAGNDSYEESFDLLIDRLSPATGCSEERIFIVPGNHDASQNVVKLLADEHLAWRELGKDMDALNAKYASDEFSQLVEEKFKNFYELEEYLGRENLIYRNDFVSVFKIGSIDIQIVIVNTAVLSAAGFDLLGEDERSLAVPEYAVRDAIKELGSNTFRIFCTHHPFAMLNEASARYLKSVIQKYGDVHLFGHMHDPSPQSTVGIEGSLYSNQAGAIFTARKDYYIGYSLISFDRASKHSETRLRTYFPDRDAFDDAVDIAPSGRFYPTQDSREFWRAIGAPVDEAIFRQHLANECLCSLKSDSAQNTDGETSLYDVFVPPPITRVSFQEAVDEDDPIEVAEEFQFEDLVHGDENIIVYALPEHGRTSVLMELQYRLLCDAEDVRVPRLPLFIDFEEIKQNLKNLERLVNSRSLLENDGYSCPALLRLGYACLILDDVNFADARRMEILREFVSKYPKVRYIFSTLRLPSSPLGFHAVPEMPLHFECLELAPLKRSQMRQLIKKHGNNKNVDVVLDRIQGEIEQINLPFTAANGSIFLIIFEEQSGFRPINRSVLIEQFVDITLKKGAADQSRRETFDYKNKTSMLAHLASWMAKNDTYVVELEQAQSVMREYVDRIGLKADTHGLMSEFLAIRLFVKKSDDRISFRYRAMLEYFISLEMLNDDDFKDWVLHPDRYLSFISEIQYYAGSKRNDANLLDEVERRYSEIIDEVEAEVGKIDLTRINNIILPSGKDQGLEADHLYKQISDVPLTEEDQDKELEAELPHDVENRQEVFRPKVDNLGHKLFLATLLYSGLLKNMELVSDADKRRHLSNVWAGWGRFLHLSLQVVDQLAEHRKIRVNGVLYVVSAPHGIPKPKLMRGIALNLPSAISRLIAANLGTEKLERQLADLPSNDEREPLLFEFFRSSLISDLRLPGAEKALAESLGRLRESRYLSQALVQKIAELRRYDRIPEKVFKSLVPHVASAIANLKGGTAKAKQHEKQRQIERLKKRDLIVKLQKSQDND